MTVMMDVVAIDTLIIARTADHAHLYRDADGPASASAPDAATKIDFPPYPSQPAEAHRRIKTERGNEDARWNAMRPRHAGIAILPQSLRPMLRNAKQLTPSAKQKQESRAQRKRPPIPRPRAAESKTAKKRWVANDP